jgi:peptidoglycan/xylan/chitin deacetylase (PgdA/CDA1 family)
MKRFVKKVAVAAGLDTFFVKRSDAGVILGFHSVEGHDGSMLSQRVSPVSPGVFEEILRYLQTLGYSFVPLSEITNGSDCSKKVAITFDDGFKSVYTNAFPILKKFRAPFTVFLITATLGADRLLWLHRIHAAVDRLEPEKIYRIMARYSFRIRPGDSLKETLGILVCQGTPEKLNSFADALASEARLKIADETRITNRIYLSPNEAIEMMQAGMTVGAHGHNHWSLETLDQSQTEAEISECKEKIEQTLGVQTLHYALPYGKTNSYVPPLLERLGFESLCTVRRSLVRMNTDSFDLPRLMVGANTDVLDLAGQITLLHLWH